MIIKHKTLGRLAEAVTELDEHYIGFDPMAATLRGEGMAPLVVFEKSQWGEAIAAQAPRLGMKRIVKHD